MARIDPFAVDLQRKPAPLRDDWLVHIHTAGGTRAVRGVRGTEDRAHAERLALASSGLLARGERIVAIRARRRNETGRTWNESQMESRASALARRFR